MADVALSKLINGGNLPRLAPDLTLPATSSGASMVTSITGIDPSAGLTTVLSITSTKGYIPYLVLSNLASENYTIKLTIDGDVIWNGVKAVSAANIILIGGSSTSILGFDPFPFNTSFLLEVQSTTDTDISCGFLMRKTL